MAVLGDTTLKGKIRARKEESRETKKMRENFEKQEKLALRHSKVYRDVSKVKKQQMELAEKRAKKGTGEEYIDSDRRIAVGLGEVGSTNLFDLFVPKS